MIVALRYGPPLRGWQLRLIEALEAAGHRVRAEPVAAPCRLPVALRALLAAERRLYDAPVPMLAPADPPAAAAAPADLALVLAGPLPARGRYLRPLFDGVPGEDALLAALLAGRAPVVSVEVEHGGGAVVLARLANEHPHVLSRALEQVLPRLAGLLAREVSRQDRGRFPEIGAVEGAGAAAGGTRPLVFLARAVRHKLHRRLGPARGRPDHWRIAYRAADNRDAVILDWERQRFRLLDDPPGRFLADPFPFEHGGRRCIFFEDFAYATGKGVIGLVEIAADGTASPPRTVLERPGHLSYPMILEHGGGIYMLPESGSARCIQLFRASAFPDRWVPDRVLVADVVAGDATIVRHADRWWLFATLSEGAGSSWDQLCLFHAPDLFGPWVAHGGNPVLTDAGAARPAGAMWHTNGVLMRVAQDCRTGYGDGLALCRVDRLDPDGYRQTVVGRLGPPRRSAADGTHTLNVAGGLATLDLRFSR